MTREVEMVEMAEDSGSLIAADFYTGQWGLLYNIEQAKGSQSLRQFDYWLYSFQ